MLCDRAQHEEVGKSQSTLSFADSEYDPDDPEQVRFAFCLLRVYVVITAPLPRANFCYNEMDQNLTRCCCIYRVPATALFFKRASFLVEQSHVWFARLIRTSLIDRS